MRLRKLMDELYKEMCSLEVENTELRNRLWKAEGERPVDRESPIDRLFEVSVRLWNCIRSSGCRTIEDVIEQTPKDWLKVSNLGRKSLDELRIELYRYGLQLKDDDVKIIRKVVEDYRKMFPQALIEELEKKSCTG